MAAGFSIANMFRNTPQVKVVNPQDPSQGQPPQGQSAPPTPPQGTPNSTLAPKQQAGTGTGEPDDSSLDNFSALWQDKPTDGKNPPTDPFSAPLFSTDPNKIKEVAGQMDFISQVPQELLQKAMSGQDPQSFLQVINHVSQASLATALQVMTGTVEQAGTKIGQRFNDAFPTRFKDLQIQGSAPSNPALSHPAAQPMLKMARQQVRMMNPDFSPEQVNKEAERYLASFASALNPAAPQTSESSDPNSGDFDWMKWAGSDTAR